MIGHLVVLKMLKKRLGVEAIERKWIHCVSNIGDYFKIPSTLIISDRCVKIGKYAFFKCNLKKVIIPRSVKSIEYCAFDGCDNAVIILEKPKRTFKYWAFGSCKDVMYVKEETRN